MKSAITCVVLAVVCVQPAAFAQQAGENINVLPVVVPVDENNDGFVDNPDWYLQGDGFLQRQVEPTIAASTRNPDHLLSFFVDYRAVDVADDIGLGETVTQTAMAQTARAVLLEPSGLAVPVIGIADLPPIAAAEAWIGMSRSYDGGLTWSGAFLPGAPFDTGSPLSTPVDGLEAASDPALVAGPCGKFYLAFMAFNRSSGESKLVVARFQDLNLADGGDSIVYQGMTVVDAGTSTKCSDYFIDKPDIEVDICRRWCSDECADRVYVSYSTFFDQNPDGSFSSNINVATSSDGGMNFTKRRVNWPFTQNQGSALTVDPRNGLVYVFWRHFNDPDAIVMSLSRSNGRWWSLPRVVSQHGWVEAFDQPSVSYEYAFSVGATSPQNPGFPETAFRTNGFPTAAVTDDGTLFAAWQERVGADGRPSPTGTPRIVLVRSRTRGLYWTDVHGAPDRMAVDFGPRDVVGHESTPEPGFGYLPQERYAGPQFQPRLIFNAGQLILAHYESRGRIANYGYADGVNGEAIVPWDVQATSFITGYDRLIDFRVALLDPDTGSLLGSSQVSRYPIRGDIPLGDSEGLMDVAPVASPCWPDSGDPGDPYCVRQANRSNANQSADGTTPFIGDYPDLAPIQQFVFDDGVWRWATEADDVPSRGALTAFTDNRHLLPPPGPNEWDGFQFYDPPFESGIHNEDGCINPASRNTNVLTSRIDTTMVLSAPTTFKDLDDIRGFPFSVQNKSAEDRGYHLEITEGAEAASFSLIDPTIDGGPVQIFAHSSGSFTVYVEPGFFDPVKVRVSEICPAPGDLVYECSNSVGTVTFNVDSGYDQSPSVPGSDTYAPEIDGDPFFVVTGDSGDPTNPFVVNDAVANPFLNPFVVNPFLNPFVVNPFVVNRHANPFVVNPFVVNTAPEDIEAVVDTTWKVTPGQSNTASTYLAQINIDNAQELLDAGYIFQLIVHKASLYGGIDLENCASVNIAQPQIINNVSQDKNAANPFVVNPFVVNPSLNPFVVNPFVVNSAFNMPPPEQPTTKADDGVTKAPPAPNEVYVTLRAFKIAQPGGSPGDAPVFLPWVKPPRLVIVPQAYDPDHPDPNIQIATTDDGNSPPEAYGDEHFTYADTPLTEVLEAFDADEDPLTFEVVGTPVNGTVSIDDDEFTFTPATGYVGDASFDFRAFDGTFFSNVATIYIEVGSSGNTPPVAFDATYMRQGTGGVLGFLEAEDIDPGDILTFTFDQTVDTTGTTVIDPVTGAFTYTPDQSDPPPSEDFGFIVTDQSGASDTGLVTITLTNDLPWHLVGFGSPWEPGYVMAVDDPAIDLTWVYHDDGGATESNMATPVVRIDRYDTCFVNDNIPVLIESWTTLPDGYDEGENWHLDFDGSEGPGCYLFEIYHPYTGQSDTSAYHGFQLQVEVVDGWAPVAVDGTYTSYVDGNLNADMVFGFLQASHSDPGAVLTFEFDPLVDPSGDVQIVPDTGEFVYIPGEAGPELTDVFRFIVSDQYGGSDTGTVTIAFSNDLRWNFIGFASPWTGSPQYSMSVDQSIDLSWFYQNPDTGAIAPSSMDTPVVWITRYPDCSFGEDIVPTGSWMTFPDEYDDGENWTLIFDGGVVGPGCYIFFIYHPYTGQSDYQTHSLEPLPLIVEVLGG